MERRKRRDQTLQIRRCARETNVQIVSEAGRCRESSQRRRQSPRNLPPRPRAFESLFRIASGDAVARPRGIRLQRPGSVLQFAGPFGGCEAQLFHEQSHIDAIDLGSFDTAAWRGMEQTAFRTGQLLGGQRTKFLHNQILPPCGNLQRIALGPPFRFARFSQNVNRNDPCITLGVRVEVTSPKSVLVWTPAGVNFAAVLMPANCV